jgi:DNA-binding transcriptional regulator YhcF (GntR family)
MQTLFCGLITSRTRIGILMRLFLNPDRRAHLRELAGELAVSPSQVQSELQNLSASGLVRSAREGNRLQFAANQAHPLFPELNSMVRKALGMDRILESIVTRLGRLELALLVGDYALGRDSGLIALVLVGAIDQRNLADLIAKTERHLARKIRPLVLSGEEYASLTDTLIAQPHLVLWTAKADGADYRQGDSATRISTATRDGGESAATAQWGRGSAMGRLSPPQG